MPSTGRVDAAVQSTNKSFTVPVGTLSWPRASAIRGWWRLPTRLTRGGPLSTPHLRMLIMMTLLSVGVAGANRRSVGRVEFPTGYGSHCNSHPYAYLAAAAVVETTKEEVDLFCTRLALAFQEFRAKGVKNTNAKKTAVK